MNWKRWPNKNKKKIKNITKRVEKNLRETKMWIDKQEIFDEAAAVANGNSE